MTREEAIKIIKIAKAGAIKIIKAEKSEVERSMRLCQRPRRIFSFLRTGGRNYEMQ